MLLFLLTLAHYPAVGLLSYKVSVTCISDTLLGLEILSALRYYKVKGQCAVWTDRYPGTVIFRHELCSKRYWV